MIEVSDFSGNAIKNIEPILARLSKVRTRPSASKIMKEYLCRGILICLLFAITVLLFWVANLLYLQNPYFALGCTMFLLAVISAVLSKATSLYYLNSEAPAFRQQ